MHKFATYAKNISLSKVPNSVIERVKLVLLDSVSAIASGNQKKNLKLFRKNLINDKTKKLVPLIGTDQMVEKKLGALINGIAMVSEELDEGNPKAKGHPAAHFLPALFSIAMIEDVSGEKLLKAFIVNYEISARLGETLQLNEEIHPHGNWGVFGNGFGLGILLDWEDEDQFVQASLLSSSFSFPTLWKSVLEGHEVRNVLIGLNNYNTMLLPSLVDAGFTASLSTTDELFNQILAKQIGDYSFNLGDEYYLLHTYFKFYPYCRFCHAPIDGTIQLAQNISLEHIKNIHIDTYSLAAKLDGKKIPNEFAGMFSIPYAVANELYSHYELTEKMTNSRKEFVKDFMQKIQVTENKKFTRKMDERRMTAIKIELSNGEVIDKTVDRATGDADEQELHTKVIKKNEIILQRIYGEEKTKEIINTILQIDELSNLGKLRSLFAIS